MRAHPDQGADHHDQVDPAQPAGLDQLGHLDPGPLGRPLAQVGQHGLLPPQRARRHRVEGRPLDIGQGPDQVTGRQDAGGGHRPLGTDGQRQGGQGAGQVAVEPFGGSGRHGGAEVDQAAGPVLADHHGVLVDGPVGDPGHLQPVDLSQQVGRPGVGRSLVEGPEVAQPGAGWRSRDQDGVVARSGRASGHHRRDPRPRPLGGQGQVGLMLDLLHPGQGQGRARVAVEDEPEDLGQELGVVGVAPVDRDVESSPVVASGEPGDPPLLTRRRGDAVRSDPELAQQHGHFLGRGQTERRPEDQVQGRRHPPAEGHAGQHVHRHTRPVHHDGDGRHDDQDEYQPLEGSRQVGQGRPGHRHRHRRPGHREPEVDAVQGRVRGPTTARPGQPLQQQRQQLGRHGGRS